MISLYEVLFLIQKSQNISIGWNFGVMYDRKFNVYETNVGIYT
jgi:hypothetical protein